MSVTKLKFILQQKDLKKPTLLYKNVLRDKKKKKGLYTIILKNSKGNLKQFCIEVEEIFIY